MESVMDEKLIFTSIASALQAEDMAAFEQTSTESRAMIGMTRTWVGPGAAHIDEAMREACPWKADDSQESFVDRVGAISGTATVLQAFAVAKGLDPGRFAKSGIWNSLPRSWMWTGLSWVVGSSLNVSYIFYDSLRTMFSFAGHKGLIKSCAEVAYGHGRIRRLAIQAKAGQLDIYSLIAELEICLAARFILDSSVVGASIDKEEWCDNLRQALGTDSPCSGDHAPSDVSSVGSTLSQEELLDINEQWEYDSPEHSGMGQHAYSVTASS
jgi:hypothetical protein